MKKTIEITMHHDGLSYPITMVLPCGCSACLNGVTLAAYQGQAYAQLAKFRDAEVKAATRVVHEQPGVEGGNGISMSAHKKAKGPQVRISGDYLEDHE